MEREDVIQIIIEFLEQNGSQVGSQKVIDLNPKDVSDDTLTALIIPSVVPSTGQWVQTTLKTMMRPIDNGVKDLDDIKQQAIGAAEAADLAAAGAENVNAILAGMTVTITDRTGTSRSVNIGFEIEPEHVYPSIAAMNADAANVEAGKFCMIATTDPTSTENAQLWSRNSEPATSEHPFTFLSDLDQAATHVWDDWNINLRQNIVDATNNANAAATNANNKASVANTAATNANTATTKANTATTNANNAATNATDAKNTVTTWFSGSSNNGFKNTAETWLSTTQATWNNWFSDSLSTGVRKIWNTFWSSINTSWNSFWGTSDTDPNGVRKQWADLHSQAESDHDTATSDHTTAQSDHSTATQDHTTAVSDHNKSTQDHTTAQADHTTAVEDHTQASQDSSRAATDHTRADSDHATAESDNLVASGDHTIAVADHNQASSDHSQASLDHSIAVTDHTTATSDHAIAASDHTASVSATSAANTAASLANDEAEYAQTQGGYAKQQGDAAALVDASLSGTVLTVKSRTGAVKSVDTKGEKGEKGDGIDYSTLTPAEKQALTEQVAEEIAQQGGYVLYPIDEGSITPTSMFRKNSIISINGVIYRAKQDTYNLPLTFVIEGERFVVQTLYGRTAFVAASNTVSNDWTVWADASNDIRFRQLEDRVAKLESIIK